jgi:hypothetical protein
VPLNGAVGGGGGVSVAVSQTHSARGAKHPTRNVLFRQVLPDDLDEAVGVAYQIGKMCVVGRVGVCKDGL